MKADAVFATFLNDIDETEVKRIPFTADVLSNVKDRIEEQFNKIKKRNPVEFSGSYKADDDEILRIADYKDTDKTVQKVVAAINGEDVGIVSSPIELRDCLGLFYRFSGLDAAFVFQCFTNRIVLDKSRYFCLVGKDAFGSIKEDIFTIGSSLQGYYKKPSDLYFCSTLQTRKVFPAFSTDYVPGATKADIEKFLQQKEFDEHTAEQVVKSDSQTIARLVWLIQNDKHLALGDRVAKVREISRALNLDCITEEGKIRLFKEVSKTKLILQIILGDVFIRGDQVLLINSKRPLRPYQVEETASDDLR